MTVSKAKEGAAGEQVTGGISHLHGKPLALAGAPGAQARAGATPQGRGLQLLLPLPLGLSSLPALGWHLR